MKTITLNILAEDIKNSNYTDSRNCAITKALKRAGIKAEDGGYELYHDNKITPKKIPNPPKLANKVARMYAFKNNNPECWGDEVATLGVLKPRSFKYSLEVPDNW